MALQLLVSKTRSFPPVLTLISHLWLGLRALREALSNNFYLIDVGQVKFTFSTILTANFFFSRTRKINYLYASNPLLHYPNLYLNSIKLSISTQSDLEKSEAAKLVTAIISVLRRNEQLRLGGVGNTSGSTKSNDLSQSLVQTPRSSPLGSGASAESFTLQSIRLGQ